MSDTTSLPASIDVHPACTGDDPRDGILVVRRGPGANCSSIGSAVEILFLSATVGAAVLAAVAAVLRSETSGDDASKDETTPSQGDRATTSTPNDVGPRGDG